MESAQWPARIAKLAAVKRRIAESDRTGLWTHHPPEPAATEDQLDEVERYLGEPLDVRYRSFLSHAGGWRSFFQSVDLFPPADIGHSPLFRQAAEMLGSLEPAALTAARLTTAELFPIAASAVDLDLFAMGRRRSSIPGTVVWFAGYEIERFGDFDSYFVAMLDYNRAELEALRQTS